MKGVRGWGHPLNRPMCWILGHKWLRRGDYQICLRCDDVKRIEPGVQRDG